MGPQDNIRRFHELFVPENVTLRQTEHLKPCSQQLYVNIILNNSSVPQYFNLKLHNKFKTLTPLIISSHSGTKSSPTLCPIGHKTFSYLDMNEFSTVSPESPRKRDKTGAKESFHPPQFIFISIHSFNLIQNIFSNVVQAILLSNLLFQHTHFPSFN